MHERISVALPTKHRIEYLTQFMDSYVATTQHLGDRVPDINILYHNPTKPSKYTTKIPEGFPVRETVIREDCGLTELWNMGIILSPTDWIFLTQDDITFNDGWIDYLEAKIDEGKHDLIHLFHYGAMLFHKSLILKIGWFDERFNGGGFEDIDYQLRISEAGLKDRVDRSHDFIKRDGAVEVGHYCNHHKYEFKNNGEGWPDNNNSYWMCQKWARRSAYDYTKPSFRQYDEINWHPSYTKRYEKKYGLRWCEFEERIMFSKRNEPVFL
jgi:hypothetical protein